MRRVRILDVAAEEAIEAAAWYERRRPGLGVDFERAIAAALDLLSEEVVPLITMARPRSAARLKRLTLKRFPYDLVTFDGGTELLVVAVAHQSRRPGYWKARLGTPPGT